VVEWSCYHDPLRLRLGFDDLSPRETTPPRQTPAAPPRFSARAFFRRTHPTTHSRRTPARRGRLRRKKHASSALCVRSFLMHTHTCSLRHAHTQQTHAGQLPYTTFPPPWPFPFFSIPSCAKHSLLPHISTLHPNTSSFTYSTPTPLHSFSFPPPFVLLSSSSLLPLYALVAPSPLERPTGDDDNRVILTKPI
jgi:hypothetical protein